MNTKMISNRPPPSCRLLVFAALSMLLMPVLASAQTNLALTFTSPATNAYGGAFQGELVYAPSTMSITGVVTVGTDIVPQTNMSLAISSTNIIVTLVPLPDAWGEVLATIVGVSGGVTNVISFLVDFLPAPAITPLFTSPATNSAPGALYVAQFEYEPAGMPITGRIVAGTAIVPQTNMTFSIGSTNFSTTLKPLPNKSGTVTAEVSGVSGTVTNTHQFVVVFRPYPPVFGSVTNMLVDEDRTNSLNFTIADPDTPVSTLVASLAAASSNTNVIDSGSMTFGTSGGASSTNRWLRLVPKKDINGAATIRLTMSDGAYTVTNSFTLTVNAVSDRSVVSGATNSLFRADVISTNIFAGVTITDVDHNMPNAEMLGLTVTLANEAYATFTDRTITYSTNGYPNQITTAIRNLAVVPVPAQGVPGSINSVNATINVSGVVDALQTNRSITVSVEVVNTPPSFAATVNPSSVTEGHSVQPFQIDFIYDPDPGDDEFMMALELVDPSQAGLVSLSATNLNNNSVGLQSDMRGVILQVAPGVLTTASEDVYLRFILTDGHGGTSVETNMITVFQAQNPPVISGIPLETVTKTDRDAPFPALPTVFVQDPDVSGAQLVEATLSQSNPSLGEFSQSSFGPLSPAELSAVLQNVSYTVTPGALPMGQTAETIIMLKVTDATGLSVSNNNRKIRITSVNNAPQIAVPPPVQQPVLIPPVDPLLPFESAGLTNDDTNNVVFGITIDNANKGTLTNLGSFASVASNKYEMIGSVPAILASLTNIIYVLNPQHVFPPDDPGGTTFEFSARDYEGLTTVRTLYIQVQDAPRNHLVVRAVNDGLPGSFTHALANASNNDVITFALPSYPAIVRMPGSSPDDLTRNVTIKGPGANLLVISGDNNGDGIPNRQLFRVAAHVVMEGVTLAHGTAGFGGAIQVGSSGTLTLLNCAVVDCVAAQYGGAIDVDGGRLTLDGCFIGRNRLSSDTGVSGAGVSVYSDNDINIINTTFSGNVQPNENGDGGGALVIENLTPGTVMNAYITHCTFAENVDSKGRASAVLGIGSNTRIRPRFSIFADGHSRNLDIIGDGFESLGGNICDDSSRTTYTQGGQSEEIFLLDHLTDLTLTDPLLAPLNADGDPTPYYEPLEGSPAIGKGLGSTAALDQRGVIRSGVPESGAIEFNALGRLVINEICLDDSTVRFIELFARRDSSPVNLEGHSLYIDGIKVHDFSDGVIIGTNALFSVGDPADPVIQPGFGIVVAFTDAPVSMTSSINPTPVVGPSVTNVALGLRGVIAISEGSRNPIAATTYLAEYLDPATGTNLLDAAGNSIALAPQFRGFALAPHGYVLSGPLQGVDMSRNPSGSPRSPGADVGGSPFGQDNAEPLALPDIFTVLEDDMLVLDVLANDFDSDGSDRLVIVDVSTASDHGAGDDSDTFSALGALATVNPTGSVLRGERIVYDPRNVPSLQQLPVGVEIIDTFYYENIDIGSSVVQAYSNAAPATLIVSIGHRLSTGDEIILSGAAVGAYNGVHQVTRIDENSFTIPVGYAGNTAPRGSWETALPRSPTSRSEASVSVRVMGANDAPVGVLDVITNVTERSMVRIMTRPERAGDNSLTFPEDPVPPPVMLMQEMLSNDYDIDSDDTWDNLQVVGIVGRLNPIAGYSGTPGQMPVVVHATGHGLQSGDEVLIANYGGHQSYNDYHVVTVVDDDSFSIQRFFVDNHDDKGLWIVLDDDNRHHIVTDAGAEVSLTLRADRTEDNIVYDASVSAFLRGLAEGELYTDRFWYAVADSHGAIGIGPIDMIVEGVNDTPVSNPDPQSLSQLDPLLSGEDSLEDVLGSGLDLMYTLTPASGIADRTDLHVLDPGETIGGTIVLDDFFVTDEDTSLAIEAGDVLANDSDIDRIDVLTIAGTDASSRKGASLTLVGTVIVYDPAVSEDLQALAREEMLIDTFSVVVSDGMTGGAVTSLVAVLVVGVNDAPTANPVFLITNEDEILAFDPRDNDIEVDVDNLQPDDRLAIVAATGVTNAAGAGIVMTETNVVHDATASELLNQLADWQSFTNVFEYTITDNSFLFAVDDEFYVPAGTSDRVLDVLANDRDFTDSEGILTIVDAGPALHGGIVSVSQDGLSLVYSSPDGFVGDDHFRYTIRNDKGDVRSGRVTVRSVISAINGILHASDDHYVVAAGETVTMNVVGNDDMLPGAGYDLVITDLVASSIPGQPILTNNSFVFTAETTDPVTFTYEISAGGESRALAEVVVSVVDRRGSLSVQDDCFSVMPGSFDNQLDVLGNDALVSASTSHLRIKEVVGPAAYGAVAVDETETKLVYTPNPDFIGVESIRYVATDGLGGTGTGIVSITVGRVVLRNDFFKLEATNTSPVTLDVLQNDRVLPNPRGATLRITAVAPSEDVAIGRLSVHPSGSNVVFAANGVLGQYTFNYEVEDSSTPARTMLGQVTIQAVGPGTYANPNLYAVLGSGENYVLDVLDNDMGYPNVNRTYSIIGIGAGADAPSAGGSVNIVDNKLIYTPAPGYFGEENFKYTMSDSIGTDVAQVTVSVQRGDLSANDDCYVVFYDMTAGTNTTREFTLPVALNDRIEPSFGQALEIVALGLGTNAPNRGGAVRIAPDKLSLIYRPVLVPTDEYVEQFTYEISDGGSRQVAGVVRVTVRNRENNLVAETQDDAFAVARNSASNLLSVLVNDGIKPATSSGWTVQSVSAGVEGGLTGISGNRIVYTPPRDFVGVDTFTYQVNDGFGGTGAATVEVRVGALPTLPDLFTVLSGSVDNGLAVLANDIPVDSYADEYVLTNVFGASENGQVSLGGADTVLYTPDSSYSGSYPYTETFLYTVVDDSGIAVTGMGSVIVHDAGSDRSTSTISLLVEGRNDTPTITNATPVSEITDKETATPFAGVTIGDVDRQLTEPLDVLVSIDDAEKGVLLELGAFEDIGNGQYLLTNAPGAIATAAIRELVFEPVENRITVPTTESAYFAISITDNKSAPVLDTNTVVHVTAVNDAPVIDGAISEQEFYCRIEIKPFALINIVEVDDLTLQPLTVTVAVMQPENGFLTNLASFARSGSLYTAVGLTAEEATEQLRQMAFLMGTNVVAPGGTLTTYLKISVDDGFAPPVEDETTSVIAHNGFETMVRPGSVDQRGSFGLSVDAIADFAVVGAPNASPGGSLSGAAFVYKRSQEGTNTWAEWRQLLPASVTANQRFGRAVAMTEERMAVAAAPTGSLGSVYIFERNLGGEDNWGESVRITPTNLSASSRFGLSVALHGNLLAVGAPLADLQPGNVAGAVVLYERVDGDPAEWREIMRWAPSSSGGTGANCGWSVALEENMLIVGAPEFNIRPGMREGAAFVFERDHGGSNAWGLAQALGLGLTNAAQQFGWDVCVDESAIAVGAPASTIGSANEAGRVYIFEREPVTNGFTVVGVLDRRNDIERRFGHGLRMDGDMLLVGAPHSSSGQNIGAAYLYRRQSAASTSWVLLEKMTRPTGSDAGLYGSAIGFQGDTAIVGAPADLAMTVNHGYAFIYRFSNNRPPVLLRSIPDQEAAFGQPFNYLAPADAFVDPDGDESIWFSVSFPSGSSGLTSDGLQIAGVPFTVGAIEVVVTAGDRRGGRTSTTFNVIVSGTARDIWNLQHFGSALTNQALEETLWGGSADPNGSGMNNDQKYVFGVDPNSAETTGVSISMDDNGNVVIKYTRRTNDPALRFHLQGSSDLDEWIDIPEADISEDSVYLNDDVELRILVIAVSQSEPFLYYSVRVEL